MKYIVSVENTSYFYWQLEILIESFLIHGIQDDLIICIAENDSPKVGGYSKNIVKYGKKVIHENLGRQKGCLVANRLYSIRNMVRSGELDCPFVIIHSDMILKNPIDKYNKSFDIVMNNFGVSKNYEVDNYLEEIGLRKNSEEDLDIPFAMPIIFNESANKEFVNNFFDKLIINFEEILKEKVSPKFPFEKATWIRTMIESYGFYSASGAFLTTELTHSEDFDVPFIHYKNGIPPIFSKKFFQFTEPFRYQNGPYECLMENNSTPNAEYVNYVIRSYLRRN